MSCERKQHSLDVHSVPGTERARNFPTEERFQLFCCFCYPVSLTAAQVGYGATNRSPECRCSQITCYPSAGFPKMKTITLGTCSFVIGGVGLGGGKVKRSPASRRTTPGLRVRLVSRPFWR